MKRINYIVFFLLFSIGFAQENYIRVNEDSISVTNFKNMYKMNIEVEGMQKAIDNYIDFQLILQEGKKKKVDTTQYYTSVFRQYISDYFLPAYDSILESHAKKDNVDLSTLNQAQKKEAVQNIMTLIGLENVQTQKNALEEVKKATQKGFKPNKQISVQKNLPVFYTAYDSLYQNDLVQQLNQNKERISTDSVDFNQFFNANVQFAKNQFAYKDMTAHVTDYIPSFKSRERALIHTILNNYIIETEVYQKADNDSLGKQAFLKANQKDFTWPVRYELEIFRYLNKKEAQEVEKALKKGISGAKAMDKYKGQVKDNQPVMIYTRDVFIPSHPDLKGYNPQQKFQYITYRNAPALVYTIKEIPSAPMSVKEAGKALETAYRNKKYVEYLQYLRQNADITIPDSLN